ncbi:uncharacterized protein LOC132047546 [Lycium ferocissimum]|uniref:uncharacterized protein LOC132047546 n=1 Tax=Lycium ferocissimum TaxID=112874 RepID=UPI002814C99E|nr:uncharacterized protein LOC132047546 [Lycium ferocissimum]
MAYALNLGAGTSNWAEAASLRHGIKWWLENDCQYIEAESDSKLLVDSVNGTYSIPWNIFEEVTKLRKAMEDNGYILKHVYRKGNQVADRLANMGHEVSQSQIYLNFNELSKVVKGLMNTERSGMPSTRIYKVKKSLIHFDPP